MEPQAQTEDKGGPGLCGNLAPSSSRKSTRRVNIYDGLMLSSATKDADIIKGMLGARNQVKS